VAAVAPEIREASSHESVTRERRRAAQAERRPRVASGVVWIVVIGALLVGVVAMNVTVLRLNIRLDKLGRERTQLQTDVAELSSEYSSAQAAARIQAQARGVGLVPASAADTTFVDLRP
jgi:cell division protein FtsL